MRQTSIAMFVFVVVVTLSAGIQAGGMAQTPSGAGTSGGEILCKQIEGTLCMDSQNSQGWAGSEFGEQLTSAIRSLPTYHGYSKGVIWVKNDNYLMTTQVTISSPYVVIRCESGAVIDYQGTGAAFTFYPLPFIYEGTGGFENCKLTNSTNNWMAGIKLLDANFIHLWNTIIEGGGTGSQSGLLFDSHVWWSEQTDVMHARISGCLAPIQFQVTGGTGSFAYTRFRHVMVSVPPGSTGAGVLLLNNAQLSGGDLEFNIFLPQNGIGIWLKDTSVALLSRLRFVCENAVGAAGITCLKTELATHIQGDYYETTMDPSIMTDSIAPGSLIAYAWNYFSSGMSQGQATPQGLLLIPNGVHAGYDCTASCGAVAIDTNTQLPGTYPHIQFPANMGNGTRTFAMEQSANTFTQTLVDTSAIRSVVVVADQGVPCTNAELTLSGWGDGATVSGVAGTGQTCEWTITAGNAGRVLHPTIADQLTNPLPTNGVVCDIRMVGGTGANTLIDQIQLSATAPVFLFNGVPGSGLTYRVVRRCGP